METSADGTCIYMMDTANATMVLWVKIYGGRLADGYEPAQTQFVRIAAQVLRRNHGHLVETHLMCPTN
jgi:hypothetical protein